MKVRPLGMVNFDGKNKKVFLLKDSELAYVDVGEEKSFFRSLGLAEDYFDEAVIKDKNLEKAIRTSLNKKEGKILNEDLERVEEIDLSTLDIKDYTGFERLVNLKNFRAWKTPSIRQVVDDLKNFKKLEYIDLGSCDLVYLKSDVFKGLENLKEVAIDGNLFYELPDNLFQDNKKLKWLHLDFTGICELNFLEGLENLESLYAEGNRINNLWGLVHTKNLTTLRLSSNSLEDIKMIRVLNKLENLCIDGNRIRSLEPLKDLNRLEKLRADKNRLTDLYPLKELESLEYLYLDNNQIQDLSPLRRSNKLVHLQIRNNKLKTVEPLKKLDNLKVLNISGNKIIDYSHLKDIYDDLTNKDF